MEVFVIATVTVKDSEKFQEYAQKSVPMFTEFEGTPIAKGKLAGFFSGDGNHTSVAIVKFPSMKKADAWYQSDAYQTLIPLRKQACDMTIAKYEIPTT